jgi:type III secretory pathway component EscT
VAPAGILDAVLAELHGEPRSLLGWGVAWARVMPTLFVVPAFGLGVLPPPLRAAMALGLAVGIAPALSPVAVFSPLPWPALLAAEALRGLPIALSAAISLWVAVIAGGVADTAGRASRFVREGGPIDRRATPFATLLGLGAAIVFLENGSAARLVARLADEPPFATAALAHAALDLAAGIGLGASIGAPLLVAALGIDVANGIVARERASLSVEELFAALRTLVVLVATAALLDRMVEAAVLLSPGRP